MDNKLPPWLSIGYALPRTWLDPYMPRILRGLDLLAFSRGHHAAYICLTNNRPVDHIEDTRNVAEFVRRLRRHQERHHPDLGRPEYVFVREVTRRDWVHTNLIVAPWSYLHRDWLCREWRRISGAHLPWVKGIPAPQGLLHYLAKEEQELPTTWGFHRLGFAQRWPGDEM